MQFNLDGHVCGVRVGGVRVGLSRQASHRASDSGNSNKPGIQPPTPRRQMPDDRPLEMNGDGMGGEGQK